MKYVISASYGNDSVAMIQWAAERGLQDVTVVYCDTGWSSQAWGERINICERYVNNLGFSSIRLESMGMESLVRMKSGFPAHGRQFCTLWLKGLPFLEWIDKIDPECQVIVMIGKRREESHARKNTPEFVKNSEYHGGRTIWHPLFKHKEFERDSLLERAGIPKLVHRSDECSPCVNANRSDLRRLSKHAIHRLAVLETDVGQPMFRAAKHAGAEGIEQVVQWAKYSPGQFKPNIDDLFITDCGSPFGCGI